MRSICWVVTGRIRNSEIGTGSARDMSTKGGEGDWFLSGGGKLT